MHHLNGKFFNQFFENIGEDKNREGLKETPKRVQELWKFLYKGYKEDPKVALKSAYFQGVCDEMIVVQNIEFYSTCEHHLLPFLGNISVGYIPKEKIVGISTIAKLIEIYSRRLQIQERLTTQIAETFDEIIEPRGVIVVCEAKHLCMSMQGVQKQNAIIKTSVLRGLFKKDPKTRAEFMQLLKS
ncbi:GTP cyclohydrolase I FolE [Helicobacter pylori]|nr:GTP cyclohydrolase I FolE [Helicobacter pylori]